eukprot:764987-Hanusia_phi.AAC.7
MAKPLLLHPYRTALMLCFILGTCNLEMVEQGAIPQMGVCRCRGGGSKRQPGQDSDTVRLPKKAATAKLKFADCHGEEYLDVKYRGVQKAKEGYAAKSMRKTVGVYSTAKIAALAYDISALIHHKDTPGSRFPVLNFDDSPTFFQREVDNGRDPLARIYSVASEMMLASSHASGPDQQFRTTEQPLPPPVYTGYELKTEPQAIPSQHFSGYTQATMPENVNERLMETNEATACDISAVKHQRTRSKGHVEDRSCEDEELGWHAKSEKPVKISNLDIIRAREKPMNNFLLSGLDLNNRTRVTRRLWRRFGSSLKSVSYNDKQMIYISKKNDEVCPYCPGPVIHDDGTNSYANPLHCSYELDDRMSSAAYLREGVERGVDLSKWREVEQHVFQVWRECKL